VISALAHIALAFNKGQCVEMETTDVHESIVSDLQGPGMLSNQNSIRDDVSHAETTSRRRFEHHHGSNAPIVTRSSDGVITIEMDAMSDNSGFYVRWNNLSYTVKSNWFQSPWNRTSKTILNNLNGFFLSGELIALMGPSGK